MQHVASSALEYSLSILISLAEPRLAAFRINRLFTHQENHLQNSSTPTRDRMSGQAEIMDEDEVASFMTLPLELRQQVLSYLLIDHTCYRIRRSEAAQNIGQVKRLTCGRRWGRTAWSCLLTNRSLSNDTLDMLYGRTTFVFVDPWLIETFMVRIGLANLHRIKHVEVSSGPLAKVHNVTVTTTLFSIISSNFLGIETLRIIGVGRGKSAGGAFDPSLWLPSHLERLEFITSLPGMLYGAKVYCDKDENNTRLLCSGAEYRKEHDEFEVDMDLARSELKNSRSLARKRHTETDGADADTSQVTPSGPKAEKTRKRAKLKPTYLWRC